MEPQQNREDMAERRKGWRVVQRKGRRTRRKGGLPIFYLYT
jgi:hypothetical protein